MRLDTLKMLVDIDAITNDEWHEELDMRHMNGKPYTQEEAAELAIRLGKVYSISHAIHCKACQDKYLVI